MTANRTDGIGSGTARPCSGVQEEGRPTGDEPSPTQTHTVANTADDFRDHLATADREGRRRWLYPRKISGKWYQRRKYLSWLLLLIMFAGPFVQIHGNPLLMINIPARRFSILGQIFWPQDAAIFAIAMLVFLTGIVVFTTAFGRLWCGWTCPQTVMMEMVFRKLEYLIEGDAPAQRVLDAAPWTSRKVIKKTGKHLLFFGVSFLVANTLLSYIIGSHQLFTIVTDDPRRHLVGLSFMILFTLVFYGIFARFREQACTFICPYGRLQSTMLDENSLVVAYDYKRGENRAPFRRTQSEQVRKLTGAGDCIDCSLCVAVCPTGIDIRNGTQMECVNCTACIDACDRVMTKIEKPTGLIRFASLNNIERGEKQHFTARMKLYSGILLALIGAFLFLLATRSDVHATLLRAPGALYQQTPAGAIENIYILKIANKTAREMPVELRLENVAGKVRMMGGGRFVVAGEQIAQTSVLIDMPPQALTGPGTDLDIGIYSNHRRLDVLHTVFAGPRTNNPNSK